MKRNVLMSRIITLGVIGSMLLSTNVFAVATAGPGAPASYNSQATEDGKIVFTFESAVERAIDTNDQLESAMKNKELLQDNIERAVQSLDGTRYAEGISAYDMDSVDLPILQQINSLQESAKNVAYTKEMIETVSEYTVLNYFVNFKKIEDSLPLLEKAKALAQTQVEQAQMLLEKGMISPNDLETARINLESAENTYNSMKITQDNLDLSFREFLKLNQDTEYVIDYEPEEYAPYELPTTLDSFISQKISTSPALKMQKSALDVQEFNIDTYVYQGDGVLKSMKYQYEDDSRAYEAAKKAMDTSMRSAYNDILDFEASRKNLENNIVTAENNLKTAKANLEVGNITQLEYDSTELALEQAQLALEQNNMDHILEIFSFENPSVNASGGSGTTSNTGSSSTQS